MSSLWSFIANSKNQKTLGWLGSGLVVAAGGAWAVFTYVWPAHDGAAHDTATVVCAQQGSVAAGRDASGNSVTINGNAPGSGPGSQSVSCADTKKPQ